MKVKLVNARLSYPNLFEPTAFENGEPKFGGDFIIEPTTQVYADFGKGMVKTTAADVWLAVADEGWKGKGKTILDTLEGSKKSLRDGDKKLTKAGDPVDAYVGHWYITAKNKTRPLVLDRDKSPLTAADGKPYSGCYVNATIDVFANTKPAVKGVFASLKGVQFAKDGASFGGGSASTPDEFDELESGADEDALA